MIGLHRADPLPLVPIEDHFRDWEKDHHVNLGTWRRERGNPLTFLGGRRQLFDRPIRVERSNRAHWRPQGVIVEIRDERQNMACTGELTIHQLVPIFVILVVPSNPSKAGEDGENRVGVEGCIEGFTC